MNQKLLPFALGALALASSAFAAEEAPSVTLYGVLHMSVDALDNGDSADLAVSSNSSRLGIKGDKALTDTSKLTYLAEWQIRATGEGENLSRRNQWIGLKQSYGEWRVGRIDTPLKNLRGKVDVFYSDQLGENRTVTSQTGFDERFDNVVQLELGTGELRGTIYYSADANIAALCGRATTAEPDCVNTGADNNDFDVWSLAGLYDTGSWYIGAGYESRSAEDITGPLAELDDPKALRVVGGFKFATDHRLGFYVEQANSIDGVEDADRKTIGASYAWKFGDNTLKAGYYIADELDSADDTGGSAFSVGLDHGYGKNTIAYVVLALADSDDATNRYTAAPSRTGHDGVMTDVALGDTTSGISVGLRHQF